MPLEKVSRVIYDKNPLDKVICQLRFPPILRIESDLPSEFQEDVRFAFPVFNERVEYFQSLPNKIGQIESSGGDPSIGKPIARKIYLFSSEDHSWNLSLTRTFLSIAAMKYERWETFIEKFIKPVESLFKIYKPAFFTRIGIRYIDIFDRTLLGVKDLSWDKLLQPYFLGLLSSPIASEIRNCQSQYEVKLEDNISLLRIITSFVDKLPEKERCYLVDSDFSYSQKTDLTDYLKRLVFLHDQADRLIRFIITERLHEAMGPKDINLTTNV